MTLNGHEVHYIQQAGDLEVFVQSLLQEPPKSLAFDLEGESNQHRYGFHVCLLQFFDGQRFTIVDPVSIADISPLQQIFENPNICKVAYATDFDVRLLRHVYGYRLRNLFDLQIAAKLLGYQEISLAYLLEHLLNLQFVKNNKMQRANWNLRPLKEEQLLYAAQDVENHLVLKAKLDEILAENNLVNACIERNKQAEEYVFVQKFRPYLSIKGAGILNREQKIVLKHLYEARETVAQLLDFPPYYVTPNDKLSEIAANPPKNLEEWKESKSVTTKAMPHIQLFMDAVEQGRMEVERRRRV